jgi:hypothetical protein
MVEGTPNRSIPEGELKQNAPEAGAGPLGLPPPEPEQPPQSRVIKSPERQPLARVLDVLEREVRLNAPDIENRPQWPSEEYMREFDEVAQLEEELMENGSPREKLIIKLYSATRVEPAPLPDPAYIRSFSLEEFHQFRSRVEPLSEDEIREEIRKVKAEFDRKAEKTPGREPPPPGTVHV